jgi:hypothetical protein
MLKIGRLAGFVEHDGRSPSNGGARAAESRFIVSLPTRALTLPKLWRRSKKAILDLFIQYGTNLLANARGADSDAGSVMPQIARIALLRNTVSHRATRQLQQRVSFCGNRCLFRLFVPPFET